MSPREGHLHNRHRLSQPQVPRFMSGIGVSLTLNLGGQPRLGAAGPETWAEALDSGAQALGWPGVGSLQPCLPRTLTTPWFSYQKPPKPAIETPGLVTPTPHPASPVFPPWHPVPQTCQFCSWEDPEGSRAGTRRPTAQAPSVPSPSWPWALHPTVSPGLWLSLPSASASLSGRGWSGVRAAG